ncbi:MAG: hypothetical protein QNJ27_04960 [Simkaniaceae bacterium]|nr:hypothetical protein [Simkaniaceae bacterium]
MVSGISGPDEADSTQAENAPKQVQTKMMDMYTPDKAPGFATMLEYWFPGEVTSQMVMGFEQGVMQMISNSINEAKAQHKKVQEEVQRRIKEG